MTQDKLAHLFAGGFIAAALLPFDLLGIDVDLATCEAILAASDVSSESGQEAMERMGLKMVQSEEVA